MGGPDTRFRGQPSCVAEETIIGIILGAGVVVVLKPPPSTPKPAEYTSLTIPAPPSRIVRPWNVMRMSAWRPPGLTILRSWNVIRMSVWRSPGLVLLRPWNVMRKSAWRPPGQFFSQCPQAQQYTLKKSATTKFCATRAGQRILRAKSAPPVALK